MGRPGDTRTRRKDAHLIDYCYGHFDQADTHAAGALIYQHDLAHCIYSRYLLLQILYIMCLASSDVAKCIDRHMDLNTQDRRNAVAIFVRA